MSVELVAEENIKA